MNNTFCNRPIALANAHDIKDPSGKFSNALRDAMVAAHAASADAHAAEADDAPPEHARAARLHRKAAEYATNEGKPDQAATHEGIARGHDALSQACAGGEPALPNNAVELGLANEGVIDADGWCLIGPFGEWPKTRQYREAGQVKEQKFIQILDNAAADKMVADFNGIVGKIKRWVSAVPVLKGHGDLNEVDPAALANDTSKIKLGTVDQLRKGPRGLEAHFALDNDGQAAVASGRKYPSGLWYVLPNGQRGDATLCQPFKLISVALTLHPNISGVESLANSGGSATSHDSEQKPNTNTEPMKLLAGWLLAQGIALANAENPTETQLLEGFQRLHTTSAQSLTALGNEKSTLSGTITSLTTERDTFKRKAEEQATALANEQAAKSAERKGRAAATVDLAIHQGKVTVAQRDAEITALENSADFATAATALLARAKTTKTAGQDAQSGKQTAALANEQAELTREYNQALQNELIETGQNPVKAHQNVMTLPKYATLAEKLRPKQF